MPEFTYAGSPDGCDCATKEQVWTRVCPECADSTCTTEKRESFANTDYANSPCKQHCFEYGEWYDTTKCNDEGKRDQARDCPSLTPGDCGPDPATQTVDCVSTKFEEVCTCTDATDGSATGATSYICTLGTNLGTLDDTCEDAPVSKECNEQCGYWGQWGDWTEYIPSCIDDVDNADTLFNDLDKHLPKRFRIRDCFYKADSGTEVVIKISESYGRCDANDRIETQFKTEDYQCTANSVFDQVAETEVETKVVVDFTVRIYEEWNDNLKDQNSTEFNNLAELYITGFLSSLQAAASSNEKVQFATVRVIAFVQLHAGDFVTTRRRRAESLSTIEAEFETVYNVLAEKDSSEEIGISAASQAAISTEIESAVSQNVEAIIDPRNAAGDWEAGELNFLSAQVQVDPAVFERAIVASYSDTPTQVCNCDTGLREDYFQCEPVEKDVSC